MPSIALYDDDDRSSCYSCPDSGSGNVKVKGQQTMLECRRYTDLGNEYETMVSVRETDIYQTGLIDIVETGVDSVKFSWGNKWKLRVQSRGGGGMSKYECKNDVQIPELIKHDKVAHTELMYVRLEMCPKEMISTELQDTIYGNDRFSDSYDPDNALSDALILAARETISEGIQYADITGVFAGANDKANAYDGILAQMYWAYTGVAYFHSVEFEIDEETLVDGMYLHAKYAGLEIDLLFDSTLETDKEMEVYATYEELYERVVDWLNDEVCTASGRNYVDATYYRNTIIVTSAWTEDTVNLSMFVDSNDSVNSWVDCDTYAGVSAKTLQGAMPIDERPVLVDWKKYTAESIITELPNDINAAEMQIDSTLLKSGQTMKLFIDKYLWDSYLNSLLTKGAMVTSFDLRSKYEVSTLDALSERGGTGIWFLAPSSSTPSLRNVAHMVDVDGRDSEGIFVGFKDNTCDILTLKYEMIHGVMVKDFRLMASNLLCSPFVKSLKEPHASTIPMLPCYNPLVRSSMQDYNKQDDCTITAGFTVSDPYKNEALYHVDGLISVLEDGATAPNGAGAVYEIQFMNETLGIPTDQLTSVTYETTITTDDGAKFVLSGENPILQYFGETAGTTFNAVQKVTLANGCTDTYNGSASYEDDFPFEMIGECSALDVALSGRVDRNAELHTITPTFGATTTDVVTSVGTITLVATTLAKAVKELNEYAVANNQDFKAVKNGLTIEITSPFITFNTFNAVAFTVTETFELSIFDNTMYDEGDGIGAVDIYVFPIGSAQPATPTFTELPSDSVITGDPLVGWTVIVDYNSARGCSFDGITGDVVLGAGLQNANLDLA